MSYRKTQEIEEILKKIETVVEKNDFEGIRCPLCKWTPKASSSWLCADCGAPEYFHSACYTSWNTFKTRGKCPTCAHQWKWTSCLSCTGWSRHEDWYVKKENVNL